MDNIDHHDQKYCCKVCAKCFPCGRSLGGHMRSHLPSSSSFDPDDKPSPLPLPPHNNTTKTKSYVLRDNPKKSCKLPSSSSSSSIEECFNPCFYSSCVEEEQEEDVALILMMLSRDTASSSWTGGGGGFNHESSDKNSIVFEDNARDYDVSDNEFNSLTLTKKRKSRYRYQCRACNKYFDTYQALGGHRASHKRTDKGSKKIIESVEYPALKKVKKEHQCSICLKVFSSGQALGGHKRSHIAAAIAIATNTDTDTEVVHHQKELESSPLMSELLDLNVPAVVTAADAAADDVHVDEESNYSINVNGAESWWNGNLE
ncbi:beta-beta-alpha zinc fingers domain-containing protein [Dioscorea alata]|uniref:Beta-beta-alpha zinc fingers domain-containing protein n=1 Tax=Dioscorea alata TaxID=55571 RepID=A0ACB7UWN5_DIOAL|nr:beta-beta-alpha zinc fingers domain-containing protein [Dioscorea alata]